jgi:TonB family protein
LKGPELLVALFLFSAATAQDQPAQTPRTTTAIEFNTVPREVIEKRLGQAVGKNDERKAALEQMFREAGCDGERLSQQKVESSKLPNVICVLPGSTDSIIIVAAHFDAFKGSQGVADNWSGTALLPSLFESLSGQSRAHTFVFIGFTDAEKGHIGSSFYSDQLTPEQRLKIKAVVNLESLGLSPTKVWLSRSDKALAAAIDGVAKAMKAPLSAMDADSLGGPDGDSFANNSIPTITLHSITPQNFPILHSARDQLAAVNMDEYFASYRLIAAFLAFLDSRLDTAARVPPQRVRISEGVSKSLLVDKVIPLYPEGAKLGRIQGEVILRVLIGTDGKVKDVKVLSGHPWLVSAARDVVPRWRYRPYLLNGQPVEVETQVTVSFTLTGNF